jgi:hypothetical protein
MELSFEENGGQILLEQQLNCLNAKVRKQQLKVSLVPQKFFKKCNLAIGLLEIFLGCRAVLPLQCRLPLGHVRLHALLGGNHIAPQSVPLPTLRALQTIQALRNC